MIRLVIFILILILPYTLSGKIPGKLMSELEKSTANRELYFQEKEEQLLALKNNLINAGSLEEEYDISKQLLFQNSYYDNNSTLYYANLCLKIATELRDPELIIEAKLNLANYQRFSGLTHESLGILTSIDPDLLSISNQREYHKVYMLVCQNYTNMQTASRYRDEYIALAIRHAESYLALPRSSTPDYLGVLTYKYFLEKNYHQALNTAKLLLKNEDLSPYMRAEYHYFLGLIYLDMGKNNGDDALEAFVTSAILSNKLAITKLISFLYVAVLLIDNDHVSMDKAYDYIDIALENATVFGDKYRHDFIKATYYSIQSIKLEKANMEKQSFKFITIIILLFVLLLFASLAILLHNYIELKSSRGKLYESNNRLRDSNRIKETYIKYFISRNSDHIEEVSRHKKYLLKMLNMGMSSDKIKQEIVAVFNTEEDYNSLLTDFDQSILELYPCFVNDINKLLKPEFFYTIDQNSKYKLNTELRILALVRLGVDDNKQIASFLRIAVQSVYNYRSKARGRAINEETFDEDLAKICMDAS